MRAFSALIALTVLTAITAASVDRGMEEAAFARVAAFVDTPSPAVFKARREAAASNATCAVCRDVSGIFFKALSTKAGAADITAIVNDVCNKLNSTEAATCRVIADIVVELGHKAMETLYHIAMPVPDILCGDILRLCVWDCCKTPLLPEQIQLAFADSSVHGRMRMTWVTGQPGVNPQIMWRPAGSGSWSGHAATTSTYTKGGWVGFIHTGVTGSLRPATVYEYRVGTSAGGFSAVYNFTTLPMNIGTEQRPLRVLSLADMGYGPNSDATVAAMQRHVDNGEVDFILHYGDIGYADGAEYGWDMYGRKMQGITTRVAYMTTPGNHELMWNFTAYKARMLMPGPGNGAPSDGLYYRLDAGPVSFFMLDSESPVNTPEFKAPQLRWLEQELAVAGARGQLLHAMHHRPPYCTSHQSACDTFADWVREATETIYFKHRVAFASFGHLHDYERTHPVFNNTVYGSAPNVTGLPPVYVVNGAAGNREGQATSWKPKPAWSVMRTSAVGYAMLQYTRPAGSLTTTVKQKFLQSSTGAVVDSFTLVKDMS